MNPEDYSLTPVGYRHRSSIHLVEGGSRVHVGRDSLKRMSPVGDLVSEISPLVATPKAPKAPPADGWVSWVDWKNTAEHPVSKFETSWQVPPPPIKRSGQTIFLFNALQTSEQDHILQPVLQWGKSAAPGGTDSWAVATFWVGADTAPMFVTQLVPVSVGRMLTGRISLLRNDGGLSDYTCEFVGIAGSVLTIENLPELTNCTETIEVYGMSDDSDFPKAERTTFSNISVECGGLPAPVSWTAQGQYPPTIVDGSPTNGRVDVVYPK